jgi:hypothetical protein
MNNSPVNLANDGINTVEGGTVRDERNVYMISRRINKSLLAEANKNKAVSADFENKYMLALNGNVYVFDYRQTVTDPVTQKLVPIAYPWDSLNITCFLNKDGFLYFGDNAGLIHRFYKKDEIHPYNDDNTAISCYWKSKLMDFNNPNRYKDVPNIVYYMQPLTRSGAQLIYLTESEYGGVIDNSQMDLLNHADMDYSRTSHLTTWYPQPVPVPARIRKFNTMQILYKSDYIDEGMKITGIDFKYSIGSEVK